MAIFYHDAQRQTAEDTIADVKPPAVAWRAVTELSPAVVTGRLSQSTVDTRR